MRRANPKSTPIKTAKTTSVERGSADIREQSLEAGDAVHDCFSDLLTPLSKRHGQCLPGGQSVLQSDEAQFGVACSVDESVLGRLGPVAGMEADELLHSRVDVSLVDFSGVLSAIIGVQVMTKASEFLPVRINANKFPSMPRYE